MNPNESSLEIETAGLNAMNANESPENAAGLPLPAGTTDEEVESLLLEAKVAAACRAIPPFWELRNMVAVNPFLGFEDQDLLAADRLFGRLLGHSALPDWNRLGRAFDKGEFRREDLLGAALEMALPSETVDLLLALSEKRLREGALPTGRSPSESTLPVEPSSSRGGRKAGAGTEEGSGAKGPAGALEGRNRDLPYKDCVVRFLAAHFDRGLARLSWKVPGGLLAGFREWVRFDRSVELAGVKGFRKAFAALPADGRLLRAHLARVAPAEDIGEHLLGLLFELPGWSGFLRRQAWDTAQDHLGDLPDFAAILWACRHLCKGVASSSSQSVSKDETALDALPEAEALARSLALAAWERATRERLQGAAVTALKSQITPSNDNAGRESLPARPAVQAVFCIDVRSEPWRRALEQSFPGCETYGFAGFFAMPFSVSGEGEPLSQCPVLLQPAADFKSGSRSYRAHATKERGLPALLSTFRRSAVGGFSFMETLGPGKAWDLLKGALGRVGSAEENPQVAPEEEIAQGLSHLDFGTRLALLKGMLKHLGLKAPYARLVVLCGHESRVENNAQAAGLACGACGGHSGEVNARIAAHLFNDPDLRQALGSDLLPEDSRAVAAVHETCSDTVRLLPSRAVQETHAADLAAFTAAVHKAASAARRKRAASLPGCDKTDFANSPATALQDARLEKTIRARGKDWAETRPEWGLADNAFFIVAPRAFTRGMDLEGRAFLHSYDAALDAGGETLELILTAPMVVASWINLQYYASTVMPAVFGSGDKTLHTVVAGLGVSEGLDGDIRFGLAHQSVADGTGPRHRPLRLQVLVAAPRDRIQDIVDRHERLQNLLRNGWVTLVSWEGGPEKAWRMVPGRGWTAEETA